MHVRRLIAENPSWLAHLTDDLKIVVSRDENTPHLIGLKYNQHESPMDNPIVRECRGMVVDVERKEVVAHPYDKFFNYGEPGAATIDWERSYGLAKLDGTLIIMYWDRISDDWAIATSGNPTAAGSYGASGSTYREVFWRIFAELHMDRPPPVLRNMTWMFELCAPDNRIVVKYEQPRIVVHGARDIDTGAELEQTMLALYAGLHSWELVEAFPFANAEDALKAATELDPIAAEGFVVVDQHFNRIKIKSPRYVELHQLKDGLTDRRAIELWKSGEAPEVLVYFPELAAAITPVHDRLDWFAEQALELTLVTRAVAADRKSFAAPIKSLPFAATCFSLFSIAEPTIDDARGHMRGMVVPALQRLLASDLHPVPVDAAVGHEERVKAMENLLAVSPPNDEPTPSGAGDLTIEEYERQAGQTHGLTLDQMEEIYKSNIDC